MPVGVSSATSRDDRWNGLTISGVACTDRTPEASMWVQILVVAIVAVVFLVRLVAALYDQPSKPH